LEITLACATSCHAQAKQCKQTSRPLPSDHLAAGSPRWTKERVENIRSQDLSQIAAFVDSRRTHWGTTWFGTPVPIVEVQFFDGQKAKGRFGVGRYFFETQRDCGFFSRSASPSEIRDFFDAVDLDDATLKEFTK
jgi:hypothetical protein